MIYVLDASAAIAAAKGEKGWDVVRDILYSSVPCFIHPVNWVEVHYKIHQTLGLQRADATISFLYKMGVQVPEIGGDDFRRRVSAIKIAHPSLSLGDCHAVAFAEYIGGTVVTSDKHMSVASDIADIKQIR